MSCNVTINGIPQKGSLHFQQNDQGNLSLLESRLEPDEEAVKAAEAAAEKDKKSEVKP